MALNINADCRIKAYLLVPKAAGPHPGIIALHDHGAHFSIGKEKVVRPFDEPASVLQDAREWVEKNYAGRWIGDELAQRGYVVLAIDMLFWGDRGRYEGVEYSEQQALASNMLQLGYSWAGYNVWDDIRSSVFLQGLAEVRSRSHWLCWPLDGRESRLASGGSHRYRSGRRGDLLDGRHALVDQRWQQPDDGPECVQYAPSGFAELARLRRCGGSRLPQADAVL